jgi:hypothetical protein
MSVSQGNHGQGVTDGRVDDRSLGASSSMPSHAKQLARLFHPSESWCARLEDDDKYFVVQFPENREIMGIAVQGHPLENKFVLKAKIEAYVNVNWEIVHEKNNYDVSFTVCRPTATGQVVDT